jgi:hypothetical protein
VSAPRTPREDAQDHRRASLRADAVQRPYTAPKEGVVEAFDAGWNAHSLGMSRETVRVLTPPSGVEWALLAWDIRDVEAKRAA